MSKRHKKHEEHEEHVNHERWLVTYADMITLLMVLFIVLFAMGQTDLAKYKKLRHSLAVGFGGPDKLGLLDGGTGVLEGGASPVGIAPADIAAKQAISTLDRRSTAWRVEKAKLEGTRTALEKSLKGLSSTSLVKDSQIRVAVSSRGLVITIESDIVLFEPGSATIRPEGQKVLDRIAEQLVSLPNSITVEGHTDNVPISGTYPSNWELSTARAASVLRSLIALHGLEPWKGTASGFADQRNVAPNDTPAGRAKNRRVEIVVQAAVSDPTIDSPEAVAAVDAANAAEAKSSADGGGIGPNDLPATTVAPSTTAARALPSTTTSPASAPSSTVPDELVLSAPFPATS
jgi:chemotaxis protein MotB